MAEIKLDDEQINKALESAILIAIGEAGREKIVKNAIDHLTRVETGTYGAKRSPLLDVIHAAAREIAAAMLKKKLEQDESFIAQVNGLYAEATARLFSADNREKLVDRLSSQMADALTKDRY